VSWGWGDAKVDAVTGKIWFDVVTQKAQATSAEQIANGVGSQDSFTGDGFDGGVKFDVGGFEAVLYGYSGQGLGTTGLYILPTSASGEKRDSTGGYVQGTYKFDRLKLGLSYGESRLDLASDEKLVINPLDNRYASNLVKQNKSGVFGLYYSLTKSITLVGEYVDTKSKAWDGNSADEQTYVLGGIIFF